MMTVSIKITRPMYLAGAALHPGVIVQAKPVDAAMAVSAGRAEFASKQDSEAANAGVIAADEKACAINKVPGRSWIRRPFEP